MHLKLTQHCKLTNKKGQTQRNKERSDLWLPEVAVVGDGGGRNEWRWSKGTKFHLWREAKYRGCNVQHDYYS